MKDINESGRSMVEMLGVLAIIGILSVGGLMGYKQAITRHNTNEAAQAIVFNASLWLTHHEPQENQYFTNVKCADQGKSGNLKDLTFGSSVDQDLLEKMFISGSGVFNKDYDTYTLS